MRAHLPGWDPSVRGIERCLEKPDALLTYGKMMEPIANETWKSFRRSRQRRRALVLLSSFGEAHVGQLAAMLSLRPNRVNELLVGGRSYTHALSLVGLGLARERPTQRGRAFEITNKGRRKARSMTARVRVPAPTRSAGSEVETAGKGGSGAATVTWSVEWRG